MSFKIANGQIYFRKISDEQDEDEESKEPGFQESLAAYPPILVESDLIEQMH